MCHDGSSDSDESDDNSGAGTKGALQITPVVNENNMLFLVLIDSFQYAPVLFSISLRDKHSTAVSSVLSLEGNIVYITNWQK